MKTQVCKNNIHTKPSGRGLLFASLLVASTTFSNAVAQDAQDFQGLSSLPAINDSELRQIQGQGIHQRIPAEALELGIILWDEGGKGHDQGPTHGKPKQSVDVIVRNNIGTKQ